METTSRVAVTGAETPLGRRIVHLLTAKRIPVVALVQGASPSDFCDWDKAIASGLLVVHRFDLLIAEDCLPPGDTPSTLVHLATGRTPEDHLAMARAARLLADCWPVTRVVYLSSLTPSRNGREHLADAQRLAEVILCHGSAGETHVVRAGLLEDDDAACSNSRSSFLRLSGWQRIPISDQNSVAQAVAAATTSGNYTEVPVRRYVRSWRL